MNQQEVMQKVRELAQAIATSEHPRNTLDIAALKSKCVELYEHIQILIAMPATEPDAEVQVTRLVEAVKPLIEQQINKPEPEPVFIPEPVAEPEPLPVAEETLFTQIPEAPEPLAEPEKPVVTETHREQPTLQDIFAKAEKQTEDQPLHTRISHSNPKNDLNEKLKSKVESLKSVISLNKKIAFVNMLFGENTVEYAKSIEKLNAASGLDEAMRYFSELKHQYNWDSDHELVRELEGLIEKRFA